MTTLFPTMPAQPPEREEFFDPALRHTYYLRPGDPRFDDPEHARLWSEARRQLIYHLLLLVQNSALGERLVLRGSLLLKAYLGESAREPGDIDWIFQPPAFPIQDQEPDRMVAELQRLLRDADPRDFGAARPQADRLKSQKIWVYERTDGRRVEIPWQMDGGFPESRLQIDISFGEAIPRPVCRVGLPLLSNGTLTVKAVDRETSLTWKLFWLLNDISPQGKDLYDAALLAEGLAMPPGLLKSLLETETHTSVETAVANKLKHFFDEDDWREFQRQYPQVAGDLAYWINRLTVALIPLWTDKP